MFPRSTGTPVWDMLSDKDFTPVSREQFHRLEKSGLIHEEFDRIATIFPDRLALVGSNSLTYRELQVQSNNAALALLKLGVQAEDVTCVVADNDWKNIATALGILRLGAVCCLISPHEKPEIILERFVHAPRHHFVLQENLDHWHSAIDTFNRNRRPHLLNAHPVDLNSILQNTPLESNLPKLAGNSIKPAFLFFTSGSTAKPQGVLMSHPFILLDIARQINDLAIRPTDRFDLLFSPNFSAFLAPTFGALLSGASCWIRSLHPSIPVNLTHWLTHSEISISTMSVSVMRALFKQLPPGRNWPSLRILSVGSEPLRASDIALFQQRTCETATLQNAMASTETRTYAQCFFNHQSNPIDPIPVGRPVLGRHIDIVDLDGCYLSTGNIGQIRITSTHLADGYWLSQHGSKQSLTNYGSFTQYDSSDLGYFDSDGLLYYSGRNDTMVKIRGQKVFLDKIESAIQQLDGVDNSFVFCSDTPSNSPQIIAWIESKTNLTESQVRGFLKDQLPSIALPSTIRIEKNLPKTSTGKIDRQALIASAKFLTETSQCGAIPDTDSTPALELLSELLQIRIQPETSIESLNIDSIQALDVCVTIEKTFGGKITFQDLRQCKNGTELAALIHRAPKDDLLYKVHDPTEGQTQLILFTSIAAGKTQFDHLTQYLMNPALVNRPIRIAIVESSRMRLPPNTACTISKFVEPLIASILPYSKSARTILAGYSWGGLIAYELARNLAKLNHPIDHLCLIDTVMRPETPQSPWTKWTARFRNLPYWVINEATQMTFDDWKKETRKKLRRIRNPHNNDSNAPKDSLYDQQYRAANEYIPEPYCGKTTVIRANTQSLTRPIFGALGWENHIHPPPEVHVVPGNHLSLLSARNCKYVAQRLAPALTSLGVNL